MCKYTVFKRCHLNGGCYRWFILAPIKICYWPQSSKVQSLGDRASYAAIAIQRFEVSDEHTRGGSFWATILALTPLSNNCSLCVAIEWNQLFLHLGIMLNHIFKRLVIAICVLSMFILFNHISIFQAFNSYFCGYRISKIYYPYLSRLFVFLEFNIPQRR